MGGAATSYYEDGGSIGTVTQVTYKNQALTRNIPAGQDGGVLRPNVLTGTGYPAVTRLAEGLDTSNGHTFGWAVRSSNLTYVGEIPFAYVSETDRVIVLEDLLFDALAPATAERHRAVVRLEDISPDSDPHQLLGQFLLGGVGEAGRSAITLSSADRFCPARLSAF